MRIAFSSLACPGWSVEQIASAAREFGYDGVEWRLADGELLGPRTNDTVWRRISRAGVPAVCLDTSAVFVQADDGRRRKAVEIAAAMGARADEIGAHFIRVFGGGVPEDASANLIDLTRAALADSASRMPAGVQMLVETHDAWSRGEAMAKLADGLDGVGVLWDVAHSVRAGEAPTETLDHIGVPALVHVKDAIGDALVPLGDGEVPLRDVLDQLRSRGYDGWISFEWEKLWHPEIETAEVALPAAAVVLRRLTG